MQDTLNYKTNGMIPHETARNIIQPIHSGDLHWSMVTTIGLSQAEKLNTIILYDSMTQFKDDGTPDIKPRVAWQAAQLLRATNNGSSIFIEVRACHQQINLVDCGMFAVANSVSLALGLNPGEVLYEPTFWLKLLEMFKTGTLDMFDCTEVTEDQMADDHMTEEQMTDQQMTEEEKGKRRELDDISDEFKCRQKKGNTWKDARIPTIRVEIPLICDCQMPESYDHVVLCDSCEEPMHLTCYLMVNLSIANAIPQLFCYSCREVGNYKFLPGSEEIIR
jgi:hypothetical protein